MLGKSHSEETKAKMSAASKGNQNTLGKSHSEESKAKMSAAQKARPKVECPHCEKAGGARVMHRWHFDNCKSR
jgi:hypothetical protein